MGQAVAIIILFAVCAGLGLIIVLYLNHLNDKFKTLSDKVSSLPSIPNEQDIIVNVVNSVRSEIESALPTLDSVLEIINKDISIKPKCPQCQGLIVKKSEFCGSCGFRLSTPRPATVNARVLDFEYDDDYDSDEPLCLDWQCLACHNDEVDTFIEWSNPRKFIHPLKCSKCQELCADLLFDTTPYAEENRLDGCIVQLAPHGSLSIAELKS